MKLGMVVSDISEQEHQMALIHLEELFLQRWSFDIQRNQALGLNLER